MMKEKIKKFIEDNINLINQNKWEEVYSNARDLYPHVGEFTEALLNCGINPLEQGLNYMPIYFLANSKIEQFIIPNHIPNISYCAFSWCKSLRNITIPNSVTSIEHQAFNGCHSLTDINYIGTKKEALTKLKVKNKIWRKYSDIKKIICTDGVIEL